MKLLNKAFCLLWCDAALVYGALEVGQLLDRRSVTTQSFHALFFCILRSPHLFGWRRQSHNLFKHCKILLYGFCDISTFYSRSWLLQKAQMGHLKTYANSRPCDSSYIRFCRFHLTPWEAFDPKKEGENDQPHKLAEAP